MGEYKPNKFQRAVDTTFKHTNKNILVGAVAGSGKTTMLVELMKQVEGDIIFVAFSSDVVKELIKRVPNGVKVKTMHSIGMSSIVSKFGRVEVKEKKTSTFIAKRLAQDHWGELSKGEKGQAFMFVPRLVDIYRLTLCESIEELGVTADEIGVEYKPQHLEYAMDILDDLKRYNRNPKEIDYTDMIYLPATGDGYFLPKADVWFIDECQDLNPCQHLLLKKARGRSRFVAVGDENQAIYGFAGADVHSFKKFGKYPNTVTMPLSICYRCPTRVVAHANKIYDIVQSPEWMKEGTTRLGDPANAKSGDMVICRNTRPLVKVFFELLKKGQKAYIKGTKMGEGLVKMVKDYEGMDIDSMMGRLFEDLKEIENELRERGIQRPYLHPNWINFQEKITILDVISEMYETSTGMIRSLKTMFAEEGSGVVLSSIHKSKGLEADNIYFLDQHLIPSPFATEPEQLIQEYNLKYVATTRAKSSLIYCYSK